jgi:16S rRNA (adenine1518-N6/adenine1519-N6)-dimethyltransferase
MTPETARGSGRAKKSLGQHFLRDANIARKIVKTLAIGPRDAVLEIGPGRGALTAHILAASPGRLVLVEKDIALAKERGRESAGRAAVIAADALTMPWERFAGGWKYIGNLPYNVASPLMWELFGRTPDLALAVFMIQKEVGRRIVAGPGDPAYGALSVWVQSFARPALEFLVPPHVFSPRPGVDSAVLSFRPLGAGRGDFSPPALAGLLHACFQMRRKQLGVIVRSRGGSAGALSAVGIDPQLRPERLTVAEFHRLAGAGIVPA